MKRVTVAMLLAVAVTALAGAGVANAQDTTRPATAPVAPVSPAAPASAARPAIAPRAALARMDDLDDFDTMDFDRRASSEARREAMADSRAALEASREANREALDESRETARAALAGARASLDATRDFAPRAMEAMTAARAMAAMPAMPPMEPIPVAVYRMDSPGGQGFSFHTPPAPWAKGDPADSVYRVARETLNRGDYGLAAKMFADIRQKFPKSAYVVDSQYYEAYARYRIGTTEELQTASRVLEPLATKAVDVSTTGTSVPRGFYVSDRRGTSNNDVAALYARINGVLAQRGDRDAAAKVAKVAALSGSMACDRDDIQVRVEALNALSQMDPNAATPLFKRVLDRKDDCSSELRRRAVFMLGRRDDAESQQLLVAAAKTDPSVAVRIEAINALPRLPNDAGIATLQDMLRTDQDQQVQTAIVRVLAASDDPKVRASMRTLIERKDAPVNLRVEAIDRLSSDRATPDDAAYLRSLYAHAGNDQIKEAILGTVSRMGGPDNDKWVMGIAENQNEPSELRAVAISRMMRSNVSIADLSRLYDNSESLNIRQQVVNALGSRKEPEATDKLIDIVKNSTVLSVRTQAINALVRKNDPRGVKLLNDILDGKAP